jgi:hypothetical protein
MGSILDEELYCIGCNIIIGVGEAEPDVDGEGNQMLTGKEVWVVLNAMKFL